METIEFILPLVQSVETSWNKITPETVKITRLVSTSSRVFLVETSLQVLPKKFIFRVFGSADLLNISASTLIAKELGKHKLAPFIYIETSTYRLEEYLEGFRNLTRSEIVRPRIVNKIAEKLKYFHSLDLSEVISSSSIVCNQNALKWRKKAQQVFQDISHYRRIEEASKAAEALTEKYFEMFNDVLPKDSPVVLAHMDTCFLNILYQEEKDEVYLLDFDYTGYCYRGFDMAMLLTDVKYDYTYPVYPYFQYSKSAYPGDEVLAESVKTYGEGVDMFIECKRCMIASNYLWALWSFSLFQEDSDSLDVLSYGLLRFREFLEDYEEFKNTGVEGLKRQAVQYFA